MRSRVVLELALCSDRLMELAKQNDKDFTHPFAGCNRLMSQYETIGAALLHYEDSCSSRFIPNRESSREFSVAVSFVPVEVLETYLDDLLDISVCDDRLFIRRSTSILRRIVSVSIAAGLGMGLVGSWSSASLMPAMLLTMCGIGFMCAAFALPRIKVVRRFSFATLVSREIATRRGQGGGNLRSFAGRMIMGDSWSLGQCSPTSYSAHAYSRYIH